MGDEASTPRGIEAGTVVAAVGAIALLVGLFLDWYSPGGFGGDGASAWTVFEIVDLLLALLAARRPARRRERVAPSARMPALPAWTVAGAGVAALVLVVTSLVDDPPAAVGASLDEGIWISFGGAVLMVVGAVLERSRIRLVVTPATIAVEDETRRADRDAEHRTIPASRGARAPQSSTVGASIAPLPVGVEHGERNPEVLDREPGRVEERDLVAVRAARRRRRRARRRAR